MICCNLLKHKLNNYNFLIANNEQVSFFNNDSSLFTDISYKMDQHLSKLKSCAEEFIFESSHSVIKKKNLSTFLLKLTKRH